MSSLTISTGKATQTLSYAVQTAKVRALMGVDTLDWNESVARIGDLKVARKYCGPGETINEHRQFVIDHPNVHTIISFISRNFDRDKFIVQMATWPVTPAGTTIVPNHEPFGNKGFTPAEFCQSIRDFSLDYQTSGSPIHIRKACILHGWFESSQPWAIKQLAALGGYDACLPPDIRALLHTVGWDLYDDANYPNYGKNLGPGYKLDRCSALALKWDKPFLLGEVGTFDPVNQKDFFDRLAKCAYPPKYVAWWDHDSTHSLVTGDLLTWFRAAM